MFALRAGPGQVLDAVGSSDLRQSPYALHGDAIHDVAPTVRGQAAKAFGARSTAWRSASSRLRSSAMPVPAMSKAVP